MKKTLYALILCLYAFSFSGYAQQAGDLAFIGFNADGDDDFSIVVLSEIKANDTIYFRDSEWNGTAFGTDEQVFAWFTGSNSIAAGTVVAFNNMSGASTVSVGSIPSNVGMGLSTSDEAIFAYKAKSANATPTLLAAIGNAPNSFGTLAGTGLTQGATAILLPTGIDIALYIGPRSGLDKGGYLSAFNNISTNWITQDGTGSQHNDGTAPDLPFDITPFTFAIGDNTSPSVASVTVNSARLWSVRFTEAITARSAQNRNNFLINPSLAIDSIRYVSAGNEVLIYHAEMVDGLDYTIRIDSIADLAGNVLDSAYTSGRLVYNTTRPNLLITEIMYNAPADNADSLEFIEIINAGTAPAVLGGLVLRDQNPTSGALGQVDLLMPSQNLAPGEILLVAPDGIGAKNFYQKDFIDLGFAGNALGNGGEALVIRNSLRQVIDSVNYDDAEPWNPAADGQGPSLERKTLSGISSDGNNWRASITLAGTVAGRTVFASPGSFTPFVASTVAFATTHSIFTEGASTASIGLTINPAPTDTVEVQLVGVDLTAKLGEDAVLTSTTVVFPAGSSQALNVALTLPENTTVEPDGYFALRLGNIENGSAGSLKEHLVYIKDNDQPAIKPSKEIELDFAGRYAISSTGTAEIVAHDPASQRLFVVNSTESRLEILDFAGPKSVKSFKSIDMKAYGAGIQSVAVKNGIVAAAVDVANFANGKAVFFNADGDFLAQVEVGNLPDMITFTPDGKRVLTANEGQPSDDYLTDPEGSVSVINLPANIADLQQSDVTTLGFNDFDADLTKLKESGVRIYGPNATVAKDMEPEYIAISEDGATAWVTLQENNAFAIIDLNTLKVIAIVPLGYKDYSLPANSLDASDRTTGVVFANFPVFGMYQPDAIASFKVSDQTYLITANEGDAREYAALEEEESFANLPLDTLAFPNADILKSTIALGRLNVVNTLGDKDGDGDFDAAYTLGGRSFSIWNAAGKQVYDSGSELERITATDSTYGSIFNASNENNNFKNRSDNKGPEPEGVTVANIRGNVYAFIALERIGGVMVYNVSDPTKPVFVQYVNSRDLGPNEGGDLGPEGIIYLTPDASPNDTALVVVANEISGTLSFFTIPDITTDVAGKLTTGRNLIVFPNPAHDRLYVEQTDDYRMLDMQGREVLRTIKQNSIDVSTFARGMYLLVRSDGAVARISLK